MSVEHMAAVLHHSRAKGTAKLVLLGIANHEGDGGAYPSVATLAKYANVEPRNVQAALTKLLALGEVQVWRQAGGTRDFPDHRRPNRYAVLVTCPPWCDRTPHHRDTRKLATAPQVGMDLGITGVTESSPGDGIVTGGVTESSPQGVTDASPKPSIEPTMNPTTRPPASSTGHARVASDWRPCSECGLPQLECERRQARLRLDDCHPYAPRVTRATG